MSVMLAVGLALSSKRDPSSRARNLGRGSSPATAEVVESGSTKATAEKDGVIETSWPARLDGDAGNGDQVKYANCAAEDQRLANDVAIALRKAELAGFELEISAQSGVATLSGTVTSLEQRTTVERAAASASKGARIDSQLQIGELHGPLNATRKTSASPRLELALAEFQKRRGYYSEARNSYSRVLAGYPESIEAIIGLAKLDQIAGNVADAERGFLSAVQLEPSAVSLGALGQFYLDQNRCDEAEPTLRGALSAAPENKTLLFYYGISLARSGQIEQAFPSLIKAVGSAAAQYNIGLILHERGDLAASEVRLAKSVAEDSKLEQAHYWLKKVRRERSTLKRAEPASDGISVSK
jgi:tetratricopeptide (TPR) repeat protein